MSECRLSRRDASAYEMLIYEHDAMAELHISR